MSQCASIQFYANYDRVILLSLLTSYQDFFDIPKSKDSESE